MSHHTYHYSQEDFVGKIDSLYRLVILASRRAKQISKPEVRALLTGRVRKPTVTALEEIKRGRVGFVTEKAAEEEYIENLE